MVSILRIHADSAELEMEVYAGIIGREAQSHFLPGRPSRIPPLTRTWTFSAVAGGCRQGGAQREDRHAATISRWRPSQG